MMRKHQSDKIDIAVAGSLYRCHGHVHLVHARNQLRPVSIAVRLVAMAMGLLLNPTVKQSNAEAQCAER